jgi:hypothetical protein
VTSTATSSIGGGAKADQKGVEGLSADMKAVTMAAADSKELTPRGTSSKVRYTNGNAVQNRGKHFFFVALFFQSIIEPAWVLTHHLKSVAVLK